LGFESNVGDRLAVSYTAPKCWKFERLRRGTHHIASLTQELAQFFRGQVSGTRVALAH